MNGHKWSRVRSWLLCGVVGALIAALVPTLWARRPAAGKVAAVVKSDNTSSKSSRRDTAFLAAGCFWSMEAIFMQLRGVDKAEVGYAGGKTANPTYEQVITGTTGYAETIRVSYDPKVISYRDLLQVLLTVRDPTTLNKQGPDEGSQYRSVIFYRNNSEQSAARQTIGQFTRDKVWKAPIVTAVEPFTNFTRAEEYHQNYYNRNPNQPYCKYVIAPEIADFRAKFKDKLKP